ncbi:MAG: LuxR C-terminal-related transcriptional regulator, partial [Candidatus Manganitrophaceae bacterium]
EVILWRGKGAGDFNDDEIDALVVISSAIGSKLKKSDSHENISLFSEIGEEELHTLVRRRAQPGILILNQQGKIEYVNHDAKNLLQSLLIKEASVSSRRTSLPEMIHQLYIQFEEIIRYPYDGTIQSGMPTINRVCVHEGIVFLFRALLLQKQGAKGDTTHILILIEKVSRGVRVDQLIKSAPLTKREQAVVRFLLEGKTNKEVAFSLDIGEYTVKDHVKRIMKKLNVTTRAGIVARVLHQH